MPHEIHEAMSVHSVQVPLGNLIRELARQGKAHGHSSCWVEVGIGRASLVPPRGPVPSPAPSKIDGAGIPVPGPEPGPGPAKGDLSEIPL